METAESFKLLGLSASDTNSDISEFVLTAPRKKRRKRRLRGATSPSPQIKESSSFCFLRGRTVALSIVAILLLCWLIVVTWLALVLHGEIRRLDTNVRGVVAGSQGVPDALQKCHSVSRELQQNQTALFSHLAVLSLQTGNFSTQLVGLQTGLQSLEERLKATPELVNVPQDLKELRASVATFGSQIRDLETTATTLKDQYNRLQEASRSLALNVTTVQGSVDRLADAAKLPQAVERESHEEKTKLLDEIAQMTVNITRVNDTLISKLNWLVDDQRNDHKLIEALQNVGQNISARVTTLEGECARESAVTSLNTTVKMLTAKAINGSARLDALDKRVSSLHTELEEERDRHLPAVGSPVVASSDLDTDMDTVFGTSPAATASPASRQPTPSYVQTPEP